MSQNLKRLTMHLFSVLQIKKSSFTNIFKTTICIYLVFFTHSL